MDSDEELAARRIGQVVGRYRLERVIGVGGMAAVYAARAADGSVSALKILHPEMSARRDVRERFFREGYVANSIQHPGAVRALEHGETPDGGGFLALELLNGETLTERLRRHGALPVAELLDYADQVLDVLVVAHQQGIVHRDLKPDNLFVTYEGRIKILDFGLARLAEVAPGDYRTRSGMALGTLPYMAPEQALGRRAEIDHRVDLFALGATLFRLLSGRKIHEGDSEAELLIAMASKPAPPLRAVAPTVPEELSRVVDLSLAFSRDARYPDSRTMQADIRAVRAGEPPPYATERFVARDEKTRTEPMGGAPSASAGPNSTVPLHVYMASRPQNLGATFSPAHNPMPPMALPPSGTAGHLFALPAKAKSRAGRWVLVGLGAIALGGAAIAAVFVVGSKSRTTVGPSPAPSVLAAGAGTTAPSGAAAQEAALPRAEKARAQDPGPGVQGAPALKQAARPKPAAAAAPSSAASPGSSPAALAPQPRAAPSVAPEGAAKIGAAAAPAPSPPPAPTTEAAAAEPARTASEKTLPAPEGAKRRRKPRKE